jgi:preprotein translocase subunit SecY
MSYVYWLKEAFHYPVKIITASRYLVMIFSLIQLFTFATIFFLRDKGKKHFHTISLPVLLVAGFIVGYVIYVLFIVFWFANADWGF